MLKYLSLAQKGVQRKKGKAKGREAVINDVKGEFEVLREGRTVPSDNTDSKRLTKKWRGRDCGVVVLGNETSRHKMNLYGGCSSLRISREEKCEPGATFHSRIYILIC